MIKLIKLHVGLYRYLKIELNKKRTFRELVLFLLITIKAYFKELIRLYNTLFLIFDKEYRFQKKQYKKYQSAQKEIKGLIKLLRYSKTKLRKAGVSKQRIKRFFITLGSTDDDALHKLCDELIKETEK